MKNSKEQSDKTPANGQHRMGRIFSRESPNSERLQRSLHRVLVVAPWAFRPHLCCLGHVSLHDAVFMVGTCELFIIALLALYFAPTVLNDGYFFFTTEFEGRGYELGYLFVVALSVSIVVVVLLLFGAIYRSRILLIPHIIWQVTLLITYMVLIYFISFRIEKVDYRPSKKKIPFPSAVVIITGLTLSSIIHIWWMAIVFEALFCMQKRHIETTDEMRNKDDT